MEKTKQMDIDMQVDLPFRTRQRVDIGAPTGEQGGWRMKTGKV